MTMTLTKPPDDPPPVRISRTLHAPRELVFKAWSPADHVKRWFAPAGFTVPEANVGCRSAAPFEVLMRAPDGVEHWARGISSRSASSTGWRSISTSKTSKATRSFAPITEVNFSLALGGTRIDVTQTYTVLDPEAAWMAEGAPQGWAQTLDNLAAELKRMQAPERAAFGRPRGLHARAHLRRVRSSGSFSRCRTRRPRRNGSAATTASGGRSSATWTSGSAAASALEGPLGRRRRLRLSTPSITTSSPTSASSTATTMRLDDKKISVSLATMEIMPPAPAARRLKVTEQGAFLDGYDDAGSRERGTGFLLDKLGASLARAP